MNPHEINVDHLFVCQCCIETLSYYEQIDPIKIEGKTFCDDCASDLTRLRLDGYLRAVGPRTNRLVEGHMRKLDADLAELIHPIRTVKHI